jgi:hypothetical protein
MSMASTRCGEIEHWTDEITDSDPKSSELVSSDIKSLTITELKHVVRRFTEDERRARRVMALMKVESRIPREPVEYDFELGLS